MLFAVSILLASLPFVAAQTSTLCDPTKKTCSADPGFDQATTVYNFQTTGIDDTWQVLGSANKISQDGNGLHFTIDAAGQAPTISTKRKIRLLYSMLIVKSTSSLVKSLLRLRLLPVQELSPRLSCNLTIWTRSIGNG